MPASQLKCQVLGHGNDDALQFVDVGRILVESTLCRYGLAFMVLHNGAIVYAIGLFPDTQSVLSKHLVHEFHGHFLYGDKVKKVVNSFVVFEGEKREKKIFLEL